MANPFDDDQMFLRHLRQQIQDAQGGNLQNERLMQSLNRPSNMPHPFFTQTTPGNPGAFASPQPLNYPGSTIPKTTPGMPQPQLPQAPKPFMMPQTVDPRLNNSSYSIPNILKSLMANNQPSAPKPPPPPVQPTTTRTIEQIMEMLKGGDRKMKEWWK